LIYLRASRTVERVLFLTFCRAVMVMVICYSITSLRALYHPVYTLNYHFVLVPKYRCKILFAMLFRICASLTYELPESNGNDDRVHLLSEFAKPTSEMTQASLSSFRTPSTISLSKLTTWVEELE
jgi:hypothetical protein